MSRQATPLPAIPDLTARVAKAICPTGNIYLTLGDEIGLVFTEADLADLFAADGAPALSPVLLLLVTICQFMEDLTDRAAAEAVRVRIDWKYALHLELEYAGFDASVLSDFRHRLLQHEAGQRVLDRVLMRLKELGLVRKGGRQRTDSTHVLMAARVLNRLELLLETMRLSLEALADYRPDWLRSIALPHWYERYRQPLSSLRLPRPPEQREVLAMAVGADGFQLLTALTGAEVPSLALALPEIVVLRQVWAQQLEQAEGTVRWRPPATIAPAAELVATPHDPAARYATKRDESWTGYKDHVTEICDADLPRLITHVETTPAPTADGTVLSAIHAGLAQLDLLPQKHIVDQGYTSGHAIVESRTQYGVELVGPLGDDTSWQARQPEGLTADLFRIDWANQRAVCPAGQAAVTWSVSTKANDQPCVHIQFAKADCAACAARTRCTHGTQRGRALKLSPHFEAIQDARRQQQTEDFRKTYAWRAGSEGTISAAVRTHDIRHSRYVGLAKTQLQALLTAAAMNLKRAALWLMGEQVAATRPAGLLCLAPT